MACACSTLPVSFGEGTCHYSAKRLWFLQTENVHNRHLCTVIIVTDLYKLFVNCWMVGNPARKCFHFKISSFIHHRTLGTSYAWLFLLCCHLQVNGYLPKKSLICHQIEIGKSACVFNYEVVRMSLELVLHEVGGYLSRCWIQEEPFLLINCEVLMADDILWDWGGGENLLVQETWSSEKLKLLISILQVWTIWLALLHWSICLFGGYPFRVQSKMPLLHTSVVKEGSKPDLILRRTSCSSPLCCVHSFPVWNFESRPSQLPADVSRRMSP